MPAFNSSLTVKKAIDSVLFQKIFDIELIVIDDGSSDNTWDIINSYSLVDDRVKCLQQSNSGAASARNNGLDYAKGEYIAFLDSDDYYEYDRFDKQIKILENDKSVGVVYGRHRVKNINDGSITNVMNIYPDTVLNTREMAMFFLRFGYFFPLCTCLIRREVIQNLRFDESFITAEDYLFIMNVALKNKFYAIDDYVAVVSRGGDSLTTKENLNIYHNESAVVDLFLKNNNFNLCEYLRSRSFQHLRFAKRWKGKDEVKSIYHVLCSILYNPFNLFSYKHLFCEVFLFYVKNLLK